MTKILAYHVRDDEQPFIDEWAKQHHVQVDSVPYELHEDTVDQAKGYDGVNYKQRSILSKEQTLYHKLHSFGIKQLAIRSAGIDSVNLDFAKQNNLKITNVPSYSPPAVAELVLTQVMQLIRHIPQFNQRTGQNNYVVNGLRSRELSELTIGIIGVGRIGGTVARIFNALGATVLGNDITEPRADLKGILTYVPKEELFQKSDIVTLHVYYDESNYHLIGKKELAQLQKTAYLINDSRGPVVDTKALIAALKQGRLSGAALDVVEKETNIFNLKFSQQTPEPLYNELKTFPNVLLTPHIGFFTDIAVENMVKQSLDATLAIVQGNQSDKEISF